MLNSCHFLGRLTKDPEIKYTNDSVPVARFNLAVERNYSRNGKKLTDFFEIEAWRQKAEFAEKYLTKGQLIVVQGSFQQYQWEDKSGNKRNGYKLVVDEIHFAGASPTSAGGTNSMPGNDGASFDAFDPFAVN